jgi:integrase/recombinase XerD
VRLRKAADALDKEPQEWGPRPSLRSHRLLLEVALGTGCRIAEIGALDWSAIDAQERTVRVRWQIPADGYGTTLQPLKGRRNRTALVLPSWWKFHVDDGTGRIVLAEGVSSVSHRVLERRFADIIEKAGIKRPGQNAHQTRHTYARLALKQGARLEELQRFLGHASIKTTEAFYGWMTEQSAAALARARIYGEGLRLVKPASERQQLAL